MMNPGQIAQQAQDPSHPANPQHPKVCSAAFALSSSSLHVEVSSNIIMEVVEFGDCPG